MSTKVSAEMRCLLLFVTTFSLSLAISILPVDCPHGYNDDGSGDCFAPIIAEADRNSAYKQCAEKNGFMFLITSNSANAKVQKMAGPQHDKIWLGLTCLGNTTSTCQWDTGDTVTWSNFFTGQGVSGKQDISEGPCVYMLVNSGKWFSAPCSNTKLWMGCQYSDNKRVPDCADSSKSNAKAYLFRDKCYYGILATDFASAESNCKSSCGNLSSIHSLGENNFIRDLVTSGNDNQFSITGLQLNQDQKTFHWIDQSPVDYMNFNEQNPSAGSCVLMELDEGEQQNYRGTWSNNPCTFSDPLAAVCQKEIVNECDGTQPTLAPPDCSGPQRLSETGTIYSPGWPKNSGYNLCQYYITEDPNTRAVVNFLALDLPANSYISLFNAFTDKTPFATLTNTNQLGTYYSTGNLMRIVFNSTSGGNVNNNFRIEYSSASTSCSGTDMTGSGTFTTLHYPDNYPVDYDQTWCLTSSLKKVQLVFTDFFTESSADYAEVFDGQGALLDMLSGPVSPNFNVTSMSNTMRVIFHSDNQVTARGFSATFTSVN